MPWLHTPGTHLTPPESTWSGEARVEISEEIDAEFAEQLFLNGLAGSNMDDGYVWAKLLTELLFVSHSNDYESPHMTLHFTATGSDPDDEFDAREIEIEYCSRMLPSHWGMRLNEFLDSKFRDRLYSESAR